MNRPPAPAFLERRRTADRIFKGALIFNSSLTVFWLVMLATGGNAFFFGSYDVNRAAVGRVLGGVFFFYVVWGFIWYGIKSQLLTHFVHFSKEERRQAFSSRMKAPFDVFDLLQRHSERRIRIADMIGRRGRFIVLGMAGFYYIYVQVGHEPSANFATIALQDNLFDAVLTSWIFLAFYYSDGPWRPRSMGRSRESWTACSPAPTACSSPRCGPASNSCWCR